MNSGSESHTFNSLVLNTKTFFDSNNDLENVMREMSRTIGNVNAYIYSRLL